MLSTVNNFLSVSAEQVFCEKAHINKCLNCKYVVVVNKLLTYT